MNVRFEWFIFMFLLFGLPLISLGSLSASWLYENFRKSFIKVKTIIFSTIFVFILGYTLFTSSSYGLSGLMIVIIIFSLASVIFSILIRFFINEGRYPKYLVGIGGIIVSISLIFYILVIIYIFRAPTDFIIHEMEYSSRFEAFYKYFLPWLLRITALLMYGSFSATLGYVLWKKNLDRFYTLIKIEAYGFLLFVASEIIHSFIFGRRIMI